MFDPEIVPEALDCVIAAPSRDRIWTSVFCHRTGMASHNAEVLVGTAQPVKLLSDGRFIGTCGVGAGAGQTLVSVWPEARAVLQPWLARTVDPPTQSQFLTDVRSKCWELEECHTKDNT